MTQENADPPEDKLTESEERELDKLAVRLLRYELQPRTGVHYRSAYPPLHYYSVRKQEKLLDAMQVQSKAMTIHSWAMIAMTIAILFAAVVQIVLLVCL